ncbi:MAG: L,D-transpeptidase family protein [Rhizobiaceae bacterium]|nr:L,D-transpeptidase family protein [Rhizobiaceae bacterium]
MRQITISRRGFVSGVLSVGFATASSQYANAASVASVMRGDALNWNGTVVDLGPLKKYYRGRLGKGIWTGTKGLNKKGAELVKVLGAAGADGLDPRAYLSALPKNIQSLSGKDLAAAELYLSQSFWKYGRDISAGRTTPSVSEPDIIISRKKADISGWLKVAARKGPSKAIAQLRPAHPQYLALRKALSGAKGAKARQIIVNMERWRWLPRDLGKRHVLVNQAAFELMIYDKGKVSDRRRVVVGKPYHKTPMFSHTLQYAEFNPTWTVPRSIAGNEILPKLRKDPGYLERNNYKVYTSWKADAPAMNAHSVDWNSVRGNNFPYRIVQQPGGKNALGQVKFMLPNRLNIYLHDTPAKQLFNESSRAFSHGCIRVHKPLEFAERLFGRSLSKSKIDKMLSTNETQRVNLKKHLPIHLAYFTAWVEGGKIKFHKDVYGRDKLVGNILFGRA